MKEILLAAVTKSDLYSPIPTIMKIILFCYFRVENAKKIRLSLNYLPLNFLQKLNIFQMDIDR